MSLSKSMVSNWVSCLASSRYLPILCVASCCVIHLHHCANFIYFCRLLFLHFKTSPLSMLSLMVMTSYTGTMLMSVLLLALPRYHHVAYNYQTGHCFLPSYLIVILIVSGPCGACYPRC
jgi:hypothetical protein